MRFFKPEDFNDKEGRIWFNASKYAQNTAQQDTTFEEPELLCTGTSTGNAGDIEMSFQELTFTCEEPEVHLVPRFEYPELESTGTVIPVILAAQFVEPHLEMRSGRIMACTFELLEIQIEEDAIMATMELGFKEPEVILIGDNSYVYMAAEMLEPECAMYIGTYLAVEIVPLDMEGLAVNGVTGKIKCKARALTMTAIAGAPAYMDLNIPLMGMEISADTPVTCTLTATAKKALCEMLGMSQNASDIDIRFKLMSITMAGDIGPVANIQVSMQPATMAMVTKQNISADIDATIALLKMKAGLLTDGPNNIDLVFEGPDTVISDDGGDCALADTLTFGG